MTRRDIHPQFDSTFEYYSSVPDTIRIALWNYFAYGFSPGSFIQCVLHNDFQSAMGRADHTWNGKSFKDLAKWIDAHMPISMRGSPDSVKQWMYKTDEERRDIMIELKLRPHEFEILRGVAVP